MNVFPVLVLNVTKKLNVKAVVLLCIIEKTLSKGIEPVQQNGIFGVLSDVWSVCTI